MIQFNLLPDIKLDYVKARRTKRLVIAISLLVSALALGLLLLLFLVVNIIQRTHLNNLNNDIEKHSQQLKNTPALDRVLTVQNQLSRVGELHDRKPVTTRLATYLAQVTPVEVTIGEFEMDLSANTMTIKGSAAHLRDINKFVDTLKFTDFLTASGKKGRAFSDVVLKNFNRSEAEHSYEISLTYDQLIFSNAEAVQLIVPATITTRSVVENPGALFKPLPPNEGGEELERR